MDRNLMILAYFLKEKKQQMDAMPEWAKAEGLSSFYSDEKSSRNRTKKPIVSKCIKHGIAGTLRGMADRLDPIELVRL